MFHIYFLGSSEGLVFDVANANFDVALWNPLRTYLELARCPDLHRRVGHHHQARATDSQSPATTVLKSKPTVWCWRPTSMACAALSTTPPTSVTTIGGSRIDGLQTAPPFVVQRLWLDRRVNRDRAAFMGTGGRPPLDNVSVLDRYERQAADWSAEVGGSVVELHAYAVTAPDDGLRDHLLGRLHELYPETAGANIIGERVLRRNDCPRFAPGDFDRRPTVDTPAKA